MSNRFFRQKALSLLIFLSIFFLSSTLSFAKEDTAHLTFKKSTATSKDTYSYTVKKGDHVLDIVRNELGITKDRLKLVKRYNPHIDNLDMIHPGQKLILPTKSRMSPPAKTLGGIIAPVEPEIKKGIIQPGAGLPSLNRLALMQTILQRMNGSMMTNGRHVIPIPEIGQISVDCEMIPVIEFDDGSIIFIDFRRQMPENIKKLIRKYWTNYTVITANAQDDILKVTADAVNSSKAYTMRKQANLFSFGQKPAIQFPADWVISGKPSSSKSTYLQAIVAIKSESQRLPEPVADYLVKKKLVITEILNDAIFASWPEKVADNAMAPLPRLNAGSTRDLILDLLAHLGTQVSKDTEVKIFDSVKDGFNLSIKAEIEARKATKNVIYTSKPLPKQFIDILRGKATEIIILSENESPKMAIEKTLSAFDIPFSSIPYVFPVSVKPETKEVKVLFPTIRFLAEKDVPFYLIDFNMDAGIYELLHDKMGFTIIRY